MRWFLMGLLAAVLLGVLGSTCARRQAARFEAWERQADSLVAVVQERDRRLQSTLAWAGRLEDSLARRRAERVVRVSRVDTLLLRADSLAAALPASPDCATVALALALTRQVVDSLLLLAAEDQRSLALAEQRGDSLQRALEDATGSLRQLTRQIAGRPPPPRERLFTLKITAGPSATVPIAGERFRVVPLSVQLTVIQFSIH